MNQFQHEFLLRLLSCKQTCKCSYKAIPTILGPTTGLLFVDIITDIARAGAETISEPLDQGKGGGIEMNCPHKKRRAYKGKERHGGKAQVYLLAMSVSLLYCMTEFKFILLY